MPPGGSSLHDNRQREQVSGTFKLDRQRRLNGCLHFHRRPERTSRYWRETNPSPWTTASAYGNRRSGSCRTIHPPCGGVLSCSCQLTSAESSRSPETFSRRTETHRRSPDVRAAAGNAISPFGRIKFDRSRQLDPPHVVDDSNSPGLSSAPRTFGINIIESTKARLAREGWQTPRNREATRMCVVLVRFERRPGTTIRQRFVIRNNVCRSGCRPWIPSLTLPSRVPQATLVAESQHERDSEGNL